MMPRFIEFAWRAALWFLVPFMSFGLLVQSSLLLIISLLKGVFVFIPVAVITIPSWTLVTALYWPRSFVATYITVAATQRLGPNLRFIALLLLPLPLVGWPVATCLAAPLFAIVVGLLWPIFDTMSFQEANRLLTGTVREPLELAKSYALQVWKFNSLSYMSYLEDLRRPYYGEPLDVSITRLVLCALLALLSSLLSCLAVLLLGLLRLPFMMARLLGEWIGNLAKCSRRLLWLWLPIWVLCVPLVPVAVLGGFLLVLGGSVLYLGPTSGVVAYLETASRPPSRVLPGALRAALDVVHGHIHALDEAALRLSGLGVEGVVVPRPHSRGPGMRRVPYISAVARATQPAPPHAAAASDTSVPSPEQQAWSTFEDLCGLAVTRAVGWGWVPRCDLADSEAYLFIGVPALALLQLLADAAAVGPEWMPNGRDGQGGGEGKAETGAGGEGERGEGNTEEEGVKMEEEREEVVRHGSSEVGAAAAAERGLVGEGAVQGDRGLEVVMEGGRTSPSTTAAAATDSVTADGQAPSASSDDAASVVLHDSDDDNDDSEDDGGEEREYDERDGQDADVEEEEKGVAVHPWPVASYITEQMPTPPTAIVMVPSETDGVDDRGDLDHVMTAGDGAEEGQRQGTESPGPITLPSPSPSPSSLQALPQPSVDGGPAASTRQADSSVRTQSPPLPPLQQELQQQQPSRGSQPGGIPAEGSAGFLERPPQPVAGAPISPNAVDAVAAANTATADAAASVCVPLCSQPLNPNMAQLLLEELAVHLLPADIGFSSAANPVRLHKSLAALQASPLEMRYMACHTVLLGDPRVSEHVPLAVAAPTAQVAATTTTTTTSHTHPGHKPHAPLHSTCGGASGTSQPASSSALPIVHPLAATAAYVPSSPYRLRLDSGGVLQLFGPVSREAGGGLVSGDNAVTLREPPSEGGAALTLPGAMANEDPGGPLSLDSAQTGREAGGTSTAAAGSSGITATSAPLPPRPSHRRPQGPYGSTSGPSAGGAMHMAVTALESGAASHAGSSQMGAAGTAVTERAATTSPMASCGGGAGGAGAGGHHSSWRVAFWHFSSSTTPSQAAAAPQVSTDVAPSSPAPGATVAPSTAAASSVATTPGHSHSPSLLGPLDEPVEPALPTALNMMATTGGGTGAPASPNIASAATNAIATTPKPPLPPVSPASAGGLSHPSHIPHPPHHPHWHRWPFGRGHRRTRSQPVGLPVGPLVPPSPRSMPGNGGGAAVAASSLAGGTAMGMRSADGAKGKHAAIERHAPSSPMPLKAARREDAAAPAVAAVAAATEAAGRGVLLVSSQRLAQLHAFTAAAQSVATALSKKERMKGIMCRLLAQHGTCGSVCEAGGAEGEEE